MADVRSDIEDERFSVIKASILELYQARVAYNQAYTGLQARNPQAINVVNHYFDLALKNPEAAQTLLVRIQEGESGREPTPTEVAAYELISTQGRRVSVTARTLRDTIGTNSPQAQGQVERIVSASFRGNLGDDLDTMARVNALAVRSAELGQTVNQLAGQAPSTIEPSAAEVVAPAAIAAMQPTAAPAVAVDTNDGDLTAQLTQRAGAVVNSPDVNAPAKLGSFTRLFEARAEYNRVIGDLRKQPRNQEAFNIVDQYYQLGLTNPEAARTLLVRIQGGEPGHTLTATEQTASNIILQYGNPVASAANDLRSDFANNSPSVRQEVEQIITASAEIGRPTAQTTQATVTQTRVRRPSEDQPTYRNPKLEWVSQSVTGHSNRYLLTEIGKGPVSSGTYESSVMIERGPDGRMKLLSPSAEHYDQRIWAERPDITGALAAAGVTQFANGRSIDPSPQALYQNSVSRLETAIAARSPALQDLITIDGTITADEQSLFRDRLGQELQKLGITSEQLSRQGISLADGIQPNEVRGLTTMLDARNQSAAAQGQGPRGATR